MFNIKFVHALNLTAILLGVTVLNSCNGNAAANSQEIPKTLKTIHTKLLRTVNLSALEHSPNEGSWSSKLTPRSFDLVKKGGFSAIRLAIRWSGHMQTSAPYTIDPLFAKRIDWAVKEATKRNLTIILDNHHWGKEGTDFDSFFSKPSEQHERFLALWKQIAERYKNTSNNVVFEIMNEPHDALNAVWNEYQNQAISIIRQSNPTRALIVGGKDWNNAAALENLQLPNDPNLIATFHHYTPMPFTHQGADWIQPIPPTGITWPATELRFRNDWQSWSWDTTLQFSNTNLNVTYDKGWAGLYIHNDKGANGFDNLNITTNRAVTLSVRCFEADNAKPNTMIVTTNAGTITKIPFEKCGNPNTVRNIMLQNNSPESQSAYFISKLELSGPNGNSSIFGNAQNEVRDVLETAANWAKRNNRLLLMGEFGSYEKADYASRVRWTRFLRTEAEKLGIAWAYFELNSGFGLYDMKKNVWRQELLDALMK